jgi:hypothetical protein
MLWEQAGRDERKRNPSGERTLKAARLGTPRLPDHGKNERDGKGGKTVRSSGRIQNQVSKYMGRHAMQPISSVQQKDLTHMKQDAATSRR